MQQQIGKISAGINHTPCIVTSRGNGKMIVLPYFDGCDEIIDDYMEDFEIYSNKEKLQKKWKESGESGDSDLII